MSERVAAPSLFRALRAGPILGPVIKNRSAARSVTALFKESQEREPYLIVREMMDILDRSHPAFRNFTSVVSVACDCPPLDQ